MTVEEVARLVLAAVDSDANFLQASRWIAERYRQLCSRSRFRHLRKVGTVAVEAPITSGTVSVTQGSNTITSSVSATITACTGVELRDRWIRPRNTWYKIIDFSLTPSLLTIELETPYSETTNASSSYNLVQRFTPIAKEARWVADTMVLQRRRTVVELTTQAELDYRDPSRILVNGFGPTFAAEIGADKDGVKIFEFYPYSTQAEVIHYVYWPDPPLLTEKDDIPNDIDPYVLREGGLIDAMRYEAARAARDNMIDKAAYWRNEYRAQSTQWERNILEAIRTDRGVDDITLMLRSIKNLYPGPIATARDEVFARGSRP